MAAILKGSTRGSLCSWGTTGNEPIISSDGDAAINSEKYDWVDLELEKAESCCRDSKPTVLYACYTGS